MRKRKEVDKMKFYRKTNDVVETEKSLEIISKEGNLVVSSRQIAERFNKRHADVLESIENIITENSAVTDMIFESFYQAGTGKRYKEYFMNRDGFSLVAMGFTGKKAMEWKIKYIAKFNELEKEAHKYDISNASPELQIIQQMINNLAKVQIEAVETRLLVDGVKYSVNCVKDTVDAIKETIVYRPDDWRKQINSTIAKIVEATDAEYSDVRNESYSLLEQRANCNLHRRVDKKKTRMGPGTKKSILDSVTVISIIEEDNKLKEIYSAIIKELAIEYLA